MFEEIKRAFGQFTFKLLYINSIAQSSPNLETLDLWRGSINQNFPPTIPILSALANSKARMHRKPPLEDVLQDVKDMQSSPERSWSHGYNIKSSNFVNEVLKTPLHGEGLHTQQLCVNFTGVYLNEEDLQTLNQMVSDVVLYGVMPFVERRITELYAIVAQERKGITHTFRRLFTGKKPKPEVQQRKQERAKALTATPSQNKVSQSPSLDTSSSNVVAPNADEEIPLYSLDSIESIIRQLADLCFVLQQYDIALEHYKLVMNDYKSDGCKEYLAGAYEMAALCAALLSKAMATPSWMNLRNLPEEPLSTTSGILREIIYVQFRAYNSNRKDMETFFDNTFTEYMDISYSTKNRGKKINTKASMNLALILFNT
ncbi:hypothetical protein RFI_27223 [Reticulomyxa filosa]|uniref:Uncharacterized protein n=1 Tax=Reticulomyxa filosa TaxID=46433 RepID=X6MAT9_RETFI|nr:hypothetical protein RFI_27223 [Reticulomyxa filosa]|eukprot:ETO10155.1 hypothetical protein RFI_27223 [Reticulomyxa filosa]